MKTVNFGKIDQIALFGGSWIMSGLCRNLSKGKLVVKLFSSQRYLVDVVEDSGSILRDIVSDLGIPFCSTEDINSEPELREYVTPTTLGLACGAAWMFQKQTVSLFNGKLLDFMGIALPKYRGGAHYSWQILTRNKIGCCNLQMVYGGSETFHLGDIIKRMEYFFPPSSRIPQDYFNAAIPNELLFLEEFIGEVERGESFSLQPLQESQSSYFPFLYTPKHGFIDWRWGTDEIERFICAFDNPYAGASTFLNENKISIKDCHAEYGEGTFHPFQAGLVYRKTDKELYVATRDGTIVVRSVASENDKEFIKCVKLGQRFYTPQSVLEDALQYSVVYGACGIKSDER